MPDFDLEPGDYRERKPKGWRWKLPWSSPEGAKLPALMSVISFGLIGYVATRAPGLEWFILGSAIWGMGIGCGIMLALRD